MLTSSSIKRVRALLLSAACCSCAQSVGVKNENPDLSGVVADLAGFLASSDGFVADLSMGGKKTSADMAGCTSIDPVFTTVGPAGWPGTGSAQYDGVDERVDLTTAGQTFTMGTFFDSTVQTVTAFHATFTIFIGGGSGGDGMAFLVQQSTSPQHFSPTANGGSLGYYGMDAWAVELDTAQDPGLGDPSANYIAFMRSTSASQTATHVPGLSSGSTTPTLASNSTHLIDVTFTGTSITVLMDGVQQISGPLPMGYTFTPGAYYFGFSAATGTGTDTHAVNNVHITTGGSGCL